METGIRTLTLTDLNQLTTSKTESYGALGVTADGRMFRYVGFGGTSTVAPGRLLVAAPTTANYQGLAITAVGTGGQVAANLLANSALLILTNGATAITQDQFAEGTLEVNQTSGSNNGPQLYKIRGNTAAAASATFMVFLEAKEPLRNASTLVAGTDTASVNPSPYSAVVASTTLGIPAGWTVTQAPNTAAITNYGWVQVTGPCEVLNDASATLAVGTGIAQSTSVAGSVVVAGATSYDVGAVRTAINTSTAGVAKVNVL